MKWIKQTSRAWRIPMVVLMSMLMQFNAFAQECNPDDLYDAIVSAYHQSFAKKSDGSWSAWGQLMASNGTGAVLSPQDVNVTNYPGMTGTPLLASTASGGSGATEQSVLLTTTGLFVWGAENVIVNTSLTSSAAFQALTIGGNTSGLPSGVLPTDVHQLFATSGALSILTNSGALYMLAINGSAHSAMLGDATATVDQTWHRVKTNSSTFLSNVIAVRGHNASSTKGAMMALCYNGVSYSAYTWGPSTYLGGGGATASYNYATAMTLPSGTPKMIGVTGGNSAARNNSYFVLMTNGSLYSLGANDVKQLGDFSTTERLSWVNVKQTASANFTNVKFISAQEHDAKYPSAAIITNAGDLYVWGENNGNMLGAADGTYNPFLPGGFTSGTDVAKFVEVGGHTTVYVKENSAKFCYVGHRTNGSMGDGTSTSTNETTFNCSATPNINICGSTGWDYGDAPVAYENGGGSNLAFHFYVSSPNSIYLGASGPISNDDAPKNVVLATDNNGSLGDGTEENSVASFPAIGTSATTYSFNITLKNSLGSNANLYVWVDWNNNRRFESTEIYTTTVASNAAIQTKTATFSGLTGLTEGRRYVRIRFTSQSLTDVAGTTNWDERALGFASDGEMEDFNLVIGTLTGVNVPPTTSNVTHSGVILSSDGAMDIDNPVGADTDGSVVAYRIISLPSKGTLYKLVGLSLFNVALNQALTAEEANNLNYDPSGLSEGVDSFQLAAIDDDGAEDATPATYTINISCSADTDGDGICDANEIPGCQDPTACNYNAAATDNNGSCTYPAQTYLNCAGNCINDTDNDGICNELEVPGCTDPTACNYNAAATDNNGSCTYPAQTYLNCDGSCINDTDNDGICNEVEIPGCTDPTACNYNAAATDDNASCTYASLEYYADNDGDGFGAGDASLYCTDPGAGYVTDNTDCDDTNASVNSAATEVCNLIDDDCDGEIDEFVTTTYYADLDGDGFGDLNNATESCSLPGGYSENSDDCDDNLLSYEDFDEDGYGTAVIVPCGANNSLDCDDFNPSIYVGGSEICGNGIDENCDGVDDVCIVNGCTDPSACNYNASANQEDGTCTYPAQSYLNCDGTCINDTDGDGVCNEIEVPGCTDPSACNYNAAATDEDASCTYPAQSYLNCEGTCINDTDGDGVCNEIEVPGCTDPTACNYDAAATDEDASCTYPAQSYLNCEGTCINDTDNDGVCNELEVPGCTDPSACNYDAAATDEDESCAFASLTFYVDADGDGFGFGDGTLYCTNPGEGFAENNSDCDDSNANISPNAEEICNLIDDDCDAEVDEFVTFTYYADVDGDGYGNASETVEACELPEGYTNNQEDCDDALLTFQDLDGDGMGSSIPDACGSVSNEDCDDNNAQIFVGATEICGNDVDEDCDGQDLICPLEGCTDTLACNYNPLAEIENGSCTYPASSSVGCNGMCIADTDGDGICDPDEIPGCTHVDACNFNSLATDDDESCIYPEPLYNCDGTCINDTDEDGVCNELEVIGCQDESACNFNASATDPSECTYPSLPYYVDEDGDNVGVGEIVLLCEVPTSGYADHPGDCDDTNPTIYAGAIELCNGVDDDCDSEIDEGVLLTFYIDTDGDGFGDNNSSIEACTAPEGYVNNDSDCDDTQVTYTDLDGDGYGSEGWVACGSYFNNDCDDNNAGINPNQTEICGNGADEDCSGDDAVCPLIVATDNNYLANEDETNIILDVLVNDNATATSILPSTLDLDVATPGIQSTVTTPAGTWTANASGQIVFTPNSNYNSILNGDAVLTYQVSDANGVISNVATVTVEITPVEDSPIIVEEMIDSLTPFQTPVEICLDAQEVDGQDNFIINVFGPNNGTVSGLEGTDYCFTYIPDSTFSGLDSIAVMMCDSGEGSICDTVWIIIEVGLGAPIAHNDESTINEDELIILNVLENDNSGDLVIDIASVDLDPSIPGIQQSYTNSDGIWSVDGNGNLAFTPSVNFNGDAHLFYTVNDTTGSTSNIALVTIHVLPVNDAPQVLDENQTVQDETNYETPIVVCINVQDVDGDNLTMTSLNGPSNGGLGQMDDGDLCFEYTPNSGFVGLDSVALVICDNGIPSLCDTVYVYINVVPTAPVVNDDNGSVNEDESVTLAILENDVTNGAALDLNTIDLDPVSPGVQSVITTSEGTWTVDGSGILNFVPAANFNGNASINYVVSDINGNLSNTGVVNISVNPINDAPNAPAVVIESTPFETAIVVCIDPSSVTDADGDQVSITSVVTDPTNGLASNVNDGDLCFTYTPNVNFTGLDSMLVTVCDNGIPSLCDTIWIYVNVEGTSPIATDDYVNSNTATVSIDVALNDIIPGNVDYTVSIVDSTSNGSVVMNGSLISYTPNFGFCGTDSLTYAICNAMGMCDTAMLIIDVTPTDADSDGISDYYETLEGDADEDGTPNYLDTDSDNDGVSDAEEAGTNSLCDANFKDCDNDGTPDYLDFFTCGVQLEIPEGFSPNGDNTNDTWVIPGVSEFPENTITVFNRWGAKVYAKSPYDNSWDGTCNENAIGGNLLPEGTYFYVFTTGPNGETKNGYVYIKR